MDFNELSLRTLECLLEQFFDDGTSNQRKQHIELSLASLTEQQGAWKQCLQFMNNSSNQYVSMFCLATLETIITKKWLILMTDEKSQMTSLLYDCCLDKHDKVPPFIRNKLLKLVVDIARYDWPHFYPNFLTNIISLIQSQDQKTIILGLSFLQITSEELICPREDISVARKEELKCLLLAHIPQIFTLLIGLLERLQGVNSTSGDEIVLAALHALSHLFSWMPLQNVNCPRLLNIICDITTKMDFKGDLALSAVNELLYKNCVPHSFLQSLISICCHGNLLIEAVLLKRDLDLEDNSCYLSKLTEFVRLMISQHWHRLESSNNNFPIFDFLSNYFRYTFHLMTVDSMFYDCLESWLSLVDYLHSKEPQHIERYNEVLVTVAQGILKKMQTIKNVDDETINEYDTYDSEYEKFINHCMELIAKIADIMPDKTCAMVMEVWHPSYTIYYQLLNSNAQLPEDLPVSLLDTVLTLTGTTRALGAMHDNFPLDQQIAILTSLASIAAQATRINIHAKHQTRPIQDQLITLHIQFLDALKSWLNNSKSEAGLEDALHASVPILLDAENQSPSLQKAAAFLLSGIAALSCPGRLLPIVEPLFASPLNHLAKNTWKMVQLALVRCVLFWNWSVNTNRLELLKMVVKQMTPGGITDLNHIIWLLQNCQTDNKESRKMFFVAIEPVLEQAVSEFPQLIDTCPEISENALKFFLESFRTFQDLIGVEFIYRAITIFLAAYQRVNLSENSCGVEQLLELLTLVIEHPSNAYKQFIPSCIELCLDQIYPHIADIPSPQIKPAFFQFFKSILMFKWHYFYSGSLLGCEPVLEHKERFCQIMVAFGQSLTQTDIRVFAQNLHALEAINNKWKLYHKDLFRSAFLGEFLKVLMINLVEKSHALLGDEIATAVYNLAAVDFNTYFNSFIPHFLSHISGLDSYQREMLHHKTKHDTDLPSFIQNIHRLANDIRCYRLCNGNAASL